MKKPYTPIYNEVIERMAFKNLSPYEWRILMVIWRKTYGWTTDGKFRKKMDFISENQFSHLTGLDRRLVHRTLKRMTYKQVIHREGNKIGFNKDCLPSLVMTGAISTDGKSAISSDAYKRKKENIQKKIESFKKNKIKTL